MSKIALITGITGQDGSYLAELLIEKKYKVHGFIRNKSKRKNIDNLWRIKKILNKSVTKSPKKSPKELPRGAPSVAWICPEPPKSHPRGNVKGKKNKKNCQRPSSYPDTTQPGMKWWS